MGAVLLHSHFFFSPLQIVKNWETSKPWLPKKRVDEVISEADKLKAWLEEKEALQKRYVFLKKKTILEWVFYLRFKCLTPNDYRSTPAHSSPAFTSEEVYKKVLALQDKVRILYLAS